MRHLKTESLEKCVAMLRQFIADAHALTEKKGIAILALEQLERVTAGIGDAESEGPGCLEKPRIYGSATILE